MKARIKVLCKKCGRPITWINDVPERGFCWGTEKNEHAEYSVLVKFDEKTRSWIRKYPRK